MRKLTKVAVTAAIAASTLGLPATAFAAPGDNGNGVGGCIAGVFYGNTSNPRPSGHGVLPSQSPGPSLNNPADPSNPFPGPSLGDVIQFLGGGAVANPGQLAGTGICPA